MIGAVCFKITENCRAKIYLVGTYGNIDWNTEFPCELGDQFVLYDFKDQFKQQASIYVAKSLDDKYILRLIETKRYILKMENDEEEKDNLPHFQNEGNKFLKCDRDQNSVSFQFINYLGRSKVVFSCGETVATLRFEVVPDKMNYEKDYIGLTEAIAEVCSELLLDFSGTTSNRYSHFEADTKTILEQFIFLRQFCYGQNLQGLFEAVKRNPDRVLDQEEKIKPFGTGMPAKKFFQNPFSYSRGWKNVSEKNMEPHIYIPQNIAVTYKFERLDTPANRFVKFALQKFDAICVALINTFNRNSYIMQIECFEEAKVIHKMIEGIFRDNFFDKIGDLTIMPQNNQVLLKREGYSQIFTAYEMIDLALQLNWKGKENIYEGESKNVALLYEYWLFFELYKIIKSIDGCDMVISKEDPFLLFEDGITISLEEGKKSCQSFEFRKYGIKINLYYNRTFSKKEFQTTNYEGSYSRPFRPDYTLAVFPISYTKGRYNGEEEAIVNGAVSYIHFDAKYRISDLTSLIGANTESIEYEEEMIDEKIESVIKTYKRGDLLKMHTYNDAIRRTIGSYVLYPGSNNKENETFQLYDEILPGIGAFSIKPSMGEEGEKELKRFITSLIKSVGISNSRLNRLKYYTEIILNEPSILKSKPLNFNKESMEKGDAYVVGYIRGNTKEDYYYFLKESSLLHKGSKFVFYFYAIKGKDVYSHHKDIFKATYFRFYINQIYKTGTYKLEPILCKITSNELISKCELVKKLCDLGYNTDEKKHHADFYYILNVEVENEEFLEDEFEISEVNRQNGNDTFSPHSPKVLIF